MVADTAILKRYRKACAKRKQWDALLGEAYRFCLPNAAHVKGASAQKKGLDVYDGVGIEALKDRAAYTVGALFPEREKWLSACSEIGDSALGAYADMAFSTAQNAIDNSNFMAEIVPAMRDAYISIGALNCDFGDVDRPLNFEASPIAQITPEESFDGLIRTNFRTLAPRIKDLDAKWPGAVVPREWLDKAESNPETTLSVVEAMLFDPKTQRTQYRVIIEKDGTEIFRRDDEAGRSILFRVDKFPGEIMGRGPVLDAMPEIKCANKVVELILKNASIAVTGIWLADDDGVLNVANIKLKPGAIIPKAVGSKGLQPLESPGRFDVSQLVLNDLRQSIRRRIFGQDLPPANQGGARTAFEIGERVKMFETVEGPHLRRLIPELFTQLARRVLYILTHPSMAASAYYIAPFATLSGAETLDFLMNVLESPEETMKRKRADARADAAVAAMLNLLGDATAQVLDMQAYARKFLKREGVPADVIVNGDAP